jgi:hypothetical protein
MRKAADALLLGLALTLAPFARADGAPPDCAALTDRLAALPGYAAEVPPAGAEDGACVLDGLRLSSDRPGWPDLKAARTG